MISTLFFSDEVRYAPKISLSGEVKPAELSLARTLIDNMSAEFRPDKYHDDYRSRLEAAIQSKIAGQEIVEQPAIYSETKVLDLMDALRKSVLAAEQQRGAQPKAHHSVSAKKPPDKLPKVSPELAAKRRPSTRQQPHS